MFPEIVTVFLTKVTVFWVMAPCQWMVSYQHLGATCCVHILGSHVERTALKMEAATSSETLVTKYLLAKLYMPEYCHAISSMPLAQGYYCHLAGYAAVHTALSSTTWIVLLAYPVGQQLSS
jgi:hypothetical protein